MAGGKMMRKSTRSSAVGGQKPVAATVAGGGGRSSMARGIKGTPKRVSFTPFYAEDSDDDNSSDFTPVSVRMTSTPQGGDQTPSPSSSAASTSGQRTLPLRGTPYPSSSSEPKLKRLDNDKGQQKRRRRRHIKTSRSVFPSPKQESKRPQATLTAQLKYLMEILPEKVENLKENNKICHAERNRAIGDLEDNLMARISIVGGLDMREQKEVIQDRQQEVLDEMTSSLVSLQHLLERKKAKLEKLRPILRASFNSRYVCCPVCAEEETKRKTGN